MKIFASLNTSVFLLLAIVITCISGLIYFVVMQNYRLTANDPQIHISEYGANLLAHGGDITSIMPPEQADLVKSLATFLIVYDDSGQSIVSSVKLDGQVPVLPQGVLEHAKKIGQNRITWQPKEGVRVGAVVTRYEGGYVLAGRSLRVVDERVRMLCMHIALGWLITMVLAFLGSWFLIPKQKSH